MADPATQTSTPVGEQFPADRDVRIEQLLLSGLDHYFRGQFETAIDVWTRVLFLDRDHPRARAYIERARAAVAERLRESEAFLQAGVEACERGDVEEARALLNGAIERGGPRDTALSVLERVDRLDGATTEAPSRAAARRAGTRRARRAAGTEAVSTRRSTLVPWMVLLTLTAAAGGWWYQQGMPAPDFSNPFGASAFRSARPATTLPGPGPLPVPSAPQLALERAEALAAEGRFVEALGVLSEVGAGDGACVDVDGVRADLQRAVLGDPLSSTVEGQEPPEAGPGRESGQP